MEFENTYANEDDTFADTENRFVAEQEVEVEVEESESDSQNTSVTTYRESEDVFWERVRITSELRDAKSCLTEASDSIATLKDQLKSARDEVSIFEAKVDALVDQLLKLDPPLGSKPTDGDEDQKPVASRDRGIVEEDESIPKTWRDVKTELIIAGIAGIGAKKRESLIDMCPTLGSLSDKLADAREKGVPFRLMLPNGFGDATADQIENRVVDEMGKIPVL